MKIKKIYLDMDGVVANFEKRYIELFGDSPDGCVSLDYTNSRDKKEFSENWKSFIDGKNFETLDWWPGGPELITYLCQLSPDMVEILSSSGGNKYHDEVVEQKKKWVENFNLPDNWKINIVAGRKRKAEYATPDSILIDDTKDVIDAFRYAGGIGIHHKDCGNTIMLLDILLAKD
jgi:hypothetical protein